MSRYTTAAALAVLVLSAGAAEAQHQGRGQEAARAEARPAQQRGTGGQKAQAQARGQGQGGQKAQARQGQGQGQGAQRAQPQQRGQGQGAQRAQPQERGQSARANRGAADTRAVKRVSRPVRLERLPERLRPMATSRNAGDRAVSIAVARGYEYNALPVSFVRTGDRLRVMNLRDELLLDMSDEDARGLGYWDVRRLDPRGVDGNAPAFCRSGAGHPVWGREWCIDKGFGLGASNAWLWGRHRPDDIVFRREDERSSLDRGGLIDVLGDIVLNRLAVHALTLGLADPLAGRWIGEPAGPRVLLLDSGDAQVAELVDWDRDGRVDVMYVVSR